MIKFILIVCAGAAGGALLGSTRSCESGGCPLTATPTRGAIYGACLAALFGFTTLSCSPGGTSTPAGPPSEHLIEVKSEEQFRETVLQAEQPVLVDFYADWCGPCKQLAPVINQVADDVAGQAKVAKVNVDDLGSVARQYNVNSIPDVRLFHNGEVVDGGVGVRDKSFYMAMIQNAQKNGQPTPEQGD